jgi:ribosomal protein S18 acetylase RimI-like enzyme
MKSLNSSKRSAKPNSISFRAEPQFSDRQAIATILSSTALFYPYEIEIALWLLDEGIRDGIESGYHFLFADQDNETIGYACYGPITMTDNRFDLYWIAVRKDRQGDGLGGELLRRAEKEIAAMGGMILYVETSGREDYRQTLNFYEKHQYRRVACLPDFYKDGDDKIIFMKKLL